MDGLSCFSKSSFWTGTTYVSYLKCQTAGMNLWCDAEICSHSILLPPYFRVRKVVDLIPLIIPENIHTLHTQSARIACILWNFLNWWILLWGICWTLNTVFTPNLFVESACFFEHFMDIFWSDLVCCVLHKVSGATFVFFYINIPPHLQWSVHSACILVWFV